VKGDNTLSIYLLVYTDKIYYLNVLVILLLAKKITEKVITLGFEEVIWNMKIMV